MSCFLSHRCRNAGATKIPRRRDRRPSCRLRLEPLEDRCLPATALSYGQLPLAFEPNLGQADARVAFLSHGSGYSLFLNPAEAVLSLQKPGSGGTAELDMRLVGASTVGQGIGLDPLPGVSNYFVGADPSRWHTNVPTYAEVKFQNVYPGIDLVDYGNQGQLEYDLVIRPGAYAGSIRLSVSGAESLTLDAQGDLVLRTTGGDVIEKAPAVYQEVNGVRRAVAARYVLDNDHQVGFAVGAYDAARPLIIDPVLSYSTYLGGSEGDSGQAIALDGAAEAYVTGQTASTDFPTAGALQAHSGGAFDVFVAKVNTAGTALVYSTYIGGSGNEQGNGIAVDAAGDAYVTGYTQSTDFPTVNPLQAQNAGGQDAFVLKLNPAGSALVFSSYYGTADNDVANGIALDAAGNAYFAGTTTPSSGNQSLFLVKVSPTGTSIGSTRLMGVSSFAGQAIAIDGNGNAYVAGGTSGSANIGHGGAFNALVLQYDFAIGRDGYLAIVGGSNRQFAEGIAVDSAGEAVFTGASLSSDFPTAGQPFQKTQLGFEDAFVAKLNAAGSALVYSTFLGGSSEDYATAMALDPAGDAYVTGFATSTDFPVASATGFPSATGFVQTQMKGNGNAFVTKLNPSGSAVLYSTYLGGSAAIGDQGNGIAVYGAGDVFVTGSTASTDFPTANALQSTLAGGMDAFITKIAFHTWRAQDVAVGSDNTARLLWDTADGQANLWSVSNSFAANFGSTYGPFSGWRAVAVATGSDGSNRILWSNTDGHTALWLVGSDGMFAGVRVFAAISGWTPRDAAVGGDGRTRILWTNANGAALVWSVDNSFNVTSSPVYGPISGWTAKSIAAGSDGLVRVLWNNVNGSAALWLLNADGSLNSAAGFGPIRGWTAIDVAIGPDHQARLLWSNVNGQVTVWSVSNTFVVTGAPAYGPFTGSSPEGLDAGPDGLVRLVWNNLDGSVALWLLNADNTIKTTKVYGPM